MTARRRSTPARLSPRNPASIARTHVACHDGHPMAGPDQWLKQVLAEETPRVTARGATFARAPEIATTELRPDGLLQAVQPELLAALPAPWCQLHREVVVEGKMPRDHLDPIALQRVILRREARQVQRLEDDHADPDPRDCGAWVIAPYLPPWLRAWDRSGRVTLVACGEGCWSITPSLFPLLWIAANDLPLRDELIPFLVARTGRPLREFVRWVRERREALWVAAMVYALPELAKMIPFIEPELSPHEEEEYLSAIRRSRLVQRIARDERLRGMEEGLQRGVQEGLQRGVERGVAAIERQFQRRLGRALTAAEHDELLRRVDTLGAERIGDVVLDLATDVLAAWLADPAAR